MMKLIWLVSLNRHHLVFVHDLKGVEFKMNGLSTATIDDMGLQNGIFFSPRQL